MSERRIYMTKEELIALGLTEEQISEVFKINGKDVEKAKGDLSTKETELASTKEQLKTANTEIESYKSMDIEGIKASAESYKTKFEAAEKKAKEEIDALKFEHSIESALAKAGAKNVKAAKALLDIESLKNSKNMDVDIDVAITKAKESDPYLYGETDPSGTGGSLGNGSKGSQGEKNPWSKEHFNLTEQGRILRENPEKAAQLKAAAK